MHTSHYIPNELRASRKAAGLRQSDIAKKLGFASTDRISRWEKGRAQPCLANLFKLAVIYGKKPDELYSSFFATLIADLEQ